MTEDVGRTAAGSSGSAARRPGPMLPTAAALVLLLGGGAAVAVGMSGAGGTPTPPALSAPATSSEPTAGPTADPGPAPDTDTTTGPAPSARQTGAGQAATPPVTPAGPAGPTGEVDQVALPVSVSIPAIGVTSDLLHLGLNPDGTLQVPEGPDFDTAAWYDGSPRPGEPGPAVIEGHVSSIGRGPSIFFDLARLEVGDTVEVARADGSVATFEVYDLQQFPKDSFPTVQVYGRTAGPELRLITCGGTIAESTGRYADNVIVFAREV